MHLITGFPKSGTQYTTILLNRLGVLAHHERVCLGYQVTVSSWHAVYSQHHFDKVLHQVRHPFDVFSTIQRIMQYHKNRHWMRELFLKFMKREEIERFHPFSLLAVWVKWNDMIEKDCKPEFTYKVEDIRNMELLTRIFNTLDLQMPDNPFIPLNKEKLRPSRILLVDLPNELADMVQEKATKYGYILE